MAVILKTAILALGGLDNSHRTSTQPAITEMIQGMLLFTSLIGPIPKVPSAFTGFAKRRIPEPPEAASLVLPDTGDENTVAESRRQKKEVLRALHYPNSEETMCHS